MDGIYEKSISVLRVMEEMGAINNNYVRTEEIAEKCGLDESNFLNIDQYLSSKKYVRPIGTGANRQIALSDLGIDFLHEQLSKRIPISLRAEMVIRTAAEFAENLGDEASIDEVKIRLSLSDDEVNSAINELQIYDLVDMEQNITGTNIILTKAGRKAVLNNFIKDPALVNVQGGPVFNAPVAAQNLLVLNNAVNSTIEQSITINDVNQISTLLTELVDQISPHLELNERVTYIQAAASLQEELKKKDPELEVIQRWLTRLSLLDSVFSVGKKWLELMLLAMPSIMAIVKFIQTLNL